MKKIVFLTGTRADFGKIKSLISIIEKSKDFQPLIFITGMHLLSNYGSTYLEIEKSGFSNLYKYKNQKPGDDMDIILSNTVTGFSSYIKTITPDLIIVHGDRLEALAGSIVGSFNNILTAHIEGGEVSGTIDELIRHSISKLSHIHFVSNIDAKTRLIQMGESSDSIHVIGSPDIDLMNSDNLPNLETIRKHYNFSFDDYAIILFHPVTTDLKNLRVETKNLITAAKDSGKNFVVIYPNNDKGSEIIIKELDLLKNHKNFKIYPSMRFESFLTLLKFSDFILGNSSAGIREAPHYGVPTINIGNRQEGRASLISIKNIAPTYKSIYRAIKNVKKESFFKTQLFGEGDSFERFFDILKNKKIWKTKIQKRFNDLSTIKN